MNVTSARRSVVGFRTTLVFVLIAVFSVCLYLTLRHDIKNRDGTPLHQRVIEQRHVALLFGGLTGLGLLAFLVRHYREKRLRAALPFATEEYVCTPVFQDALTRLFNQQKSEETLKALHGSHAGSDATHASESIDVAAPESEKDTISATHPLIEGTGWIMVGGSNPSAHQR